MPEGESFAQVQKRGVEACQNIVNKHPDETIAITAHGGILHIYLLMLCICHFAIFGL